MAHEEKQIHFDAFETYLDFRMNNQPVSKSIGLVADKYEYSNRMVWKWYQWFDWRSREKERRAEIQEITVRKHNQEIAKNKNNYLKVAHKLLDNFIKDDFPTEIVSVRDLETVVKLCLLLQEEATEISKGETVNVDLTDQVNKLFDEDKMRLILEQENMIEPSEDKEDDDEDVIDYELYIGEDDEEE